MADKSKGPKTQLTTGGSHSLKVAKTWLRIALKDMHGAPLAGKKYKLTVKEGGSNKEFSDNTTPQGVVEQQDRSDVTEGHLEVWLEPDLSCKYELKIGALVPADQEKGIKARLNNLGFDCGGTNGDPDATKAAIEGFQRTRKLPVTGKVDDATRMKLVQEHGS